MMKIDEHEEKRRRKQVAY